METYLIVLLTAAASYLIGAIPFGYLIARARGIDILQQGSGNIGATNVGRILGWRFGILVFLLDFGKGALPTAVGLALDRAFEIEPQYVAGVAGGLAAFVGHLFPIYLRFRGGKGVATGAGVVAVLLPLPTLAAVATWAVILSASRFVSLASITAAAILCAVYFTLTPEPFAAHRLILTWFCMIAVALVLVKHRANVRRLLDGTENRLPEGRSMPLLAKTIHVLALGLWFGMAVFFSFPVALTLFGSFESLAETDARPNWFPLPAEFKLEPGLQKSQGTRAAGFAISPLFDHYFLWQGICGLLATVTALSWSKVEPGRKVHGIRGMVLLLALTTVILGWPIERSVSDLRRARNDASDQLMVALQTHGQPGVESARQKNETVRKEFATWHLWSLLLNMVTILLVTIAMALAAQLPANVTSSSAPYKDGSPAHAAIPPPH